MLNPPPFKLANSSKIASGLVGAALHANCCNGTEKAVETDAVHSSEKPGRTKLADLDTNFQCSIIGTCLTTASLRKVMSRFIHVIDVSDLDIHHEAVWMASEPGAASKALNKALDHQHAATLLRFSRVPDAAELGALWDEAMRSGDIPGAYWALLTHRHTTVELRKKVFGDVHMLSHLVGAANRADIRRLVALEQTNADLRAQLETQQEKTIAQDVTLQDLMRELAETRRSLQAAQSRDVALQDSREQLQRAQLANNQVAVQTQRREAAEHAESRAQEAVLRFQAEAEYFRKHAATLSAELGAAESQLRDLVEGGLGSESSIKLDHRLAGRRILYVGGRPSSTPSIRALVERHHGDFRHHDGGLEDRKGLLTASVRWAETVVFPVDCVDHDSVGVLKRLCARHDIEFLPLRSAGMGSFVSAMHAETASFQALDDASGHPCRKHG